MQRGSWNFVLGLALTLSSILALPPNVAVAQSMVGRSAPNVILPQGGMFGVTPKTKLSDYRGEVVLLVFWSTKCSRCRTHMALIQRLHQRYKGRGLKVLAVASSSHSDLRSYMRRNRYNFGVGADPRSVNLFKYGVKHYPATFIIGRDGRVKSSHGKLYRAIERELRVARK